MNKRRNFLKHLFGVFAIAVMTGSLFGMAPTTDNNADMNIFRKANSALKESRAKSAAAQKGLTILEGFDDRGMQWFNFESEVAGSRNTQRHSNEVLYNKTGVAFLMKHLTDNGEQNTPLYKFLNDAKLRIASPGWKGDSYYGNYLLIPGRGEGQNLCGFLMNNDSIAFDNFLKAALKAVRKLCVEHGKDLKRREELVRSTCAGICSTREGAARLAQTRADTKNQSATAAVRLFDASIAENKRKMVENIKKMLSSKKFLLYGGAVVSTCAALYGLKLAFSYIKKQMETPETLDRINISSCPDLSDLVVEVGLQKKLERTVEDITENGHLYNILLSGPPGTGKTMFAKGIAKRMSVNLSNVEFFFTSGSRFAQMEVYKAVEEFHKLVDYVRKRAEQGIRVVVFVDEAERMFAARYGRFATALTRALTEAFLASVPAPSNDGYMFIMATNHQEQLDNAIFDRTSGHQFLVSLPASAERGKLLANYMKKFAEESGVQIDFDFERSEKRNQLIAMMSGFSARGIEEMAHNFVREGMRDEQNTIRFNSSLDIVKAQAEALKRQNSLIAMRKAEDAKVYGIAAAAA